MTPTSRVAKAPGKAPTISGLHDWPPFQPQFLPPVRSQESTNVWTSYVGLDRSIRRQFYVRRNFSALKLHFLRRFNYQQSQRPHQLRFHQFRQPQQKRSLLFIRLRQDMVLVVKIIERLCQLKRILRHERRLLRGNRRLHCVLQRSRRNQQLPERISLRTRKYRPGGFPCYLHVRLPRFFTLSPNPANSHHRILAIRPRLALKTQRILEVKRDNRVARKFQQEKSQRPHSDRMRRQLLLFSCHLRMPLLHFRQRRRLQLVQQIVRFHAKPFAPAHFHIWLLRLFRRKLVAHFRRTPRRQRHNLIRQVNRPLRRLDVSQRPQSRRHHFLQISLPRINHVVNACRRLPKVRRLQIIRPASRSPNRLPLQRVFFRCRQPRYRPLPVMKI